MRELLVDDRRETGEDGREHRYRYYVLVGEMPLGGLSCESYGVKVAGGDGEEASVPNITVSAARIDALLELDAPEQGAVCVVPEDDDEYYRYNPSAKNRNE